VRLAHFQGIVVANKTHEQASESNLLLESFVAPLLFGLLVIAELSDEID
jgi:hypothetical protein